MSENSYPTTLASTSSAGPDDVANTVEGHGNIDDDIPQNVKGKCRFNSKYLRKIHIVVSEVKYKKNKCPYCPFEDIKMRQWLPNYITICNHSIEKSSASVTLCG